MALKIKVEKGEEEWRDNCTSALQQYLYMQEQELYTDCTFVVGKEQQRFACHRLVMARASSVFAAMVYGPMSTVTNQLKISYMSPATFSYLLKFCYTDTVVLGSCEQAIELCYTASKYQIQRLVTLCINYLCSNLQDSCVLPALELANILDNQTLILKTIKMLQERTELVVAAPGFEEIHHSTLITLLQQNQLNISSEIVLIEAVVKWARGEAMRQGKLQDGRGLRAALGPDTLLHLRFLSLNTEQFARSVKSLQLLSETEKLSIMLNLTVPGECDPLLDGLCTERNARCNPNLLNQNTYTLVRSSPAEETFGCFKTLGYFGCSLSLKVSQPVWIHGCEIFTQEIDTSRQAKKKKCTDIPDCGYDEKMKATLLKVTESDIGMAEIIAATEIRVLANYKSLVKIMFDEPVFIDQEAGFYYCLNVHLLRKGEYPIKRTHSFQKFGNIEFNFGSPFRNSFYWGHSSIVASLIFYGDVKVRSSPTISN